MSATIHDSSAPNNSGSAPINNSPGVVASSSATVLSFPQKITGSFRPGYAVASKAWLKPLVADPQFTNGEVRVCVAIYLTFNQKHYERTGELRGWEGWVTLQGDTTLSESTVERTFDKLERLGALEIFRGGFDPKTGQKQGNKYRAKFDCHPSPMTGGHPSNPPVTHDGRLCERLGDKILEREVSLSEGKTTAPASPSPRSARPPSPARIKVEYDSDNWRWLYKYGPQVLGKSFERTEGFKWQMVDQADIDAVDAFLLAEAEKLKTMKTWSTPQVVEVTGRERELILEAS